MTEKDKKYVFQMAKKMALRSLRELRGDPLISSRNDFDKELRKVLAKWIKDINEDIYVGQIIDVWGSFYKARSGVDK